LLNQLFAKKPLERLLAEAAGEKRLRRVLGPVALTSLGVGAIIGAGINDEENRSRRQARETRALPGLNSYVQTRRW
jgi:hypothetical protein